MVHRGVAMLWRAVDVLAANREVRSDCTTNSEWDAVEQWLKHQMAERKSNKTELLEESHPTQEQDVDTSRPNPKKNLRGGKQSPRKRTGVASRAKTSSRAAGVKASPKAVGAPIPARSNGETKQQQQVKGRGGASSGQGRPPSLAAAAAAGVGGGSCEQFMDRDFMQQMQRRLLEEHEETLRRRIRQRQAEEAQRERQLVQAGLMAPPSPPPGPTLPSSGRRQQAGSSSAGSRVSSRSARRTPRPLTAPRPRRTLSSRVHPKPQRAGPQEKAGPSCAAAKKAEEEAELTRDLDEAATEGGAAPPAPKRPVDLRPRLAILLQACRAVAGAQLAPDLEPSTSASTAGAPDHEQRQGGSLRNLKFESPLMAKLREVESVEELYRLAELIVASTKHQ